MDALDSNGAVFGILIGFWFVFFIAVLKGPKGPKGCRP